MKKTVTGIAAASLALGALAPMAFAAASTYTPYKTSIVVNGQTLSNPYAFAFSDGSNNTTYIPIYYVGKALEAAGFKQVWTGNTWVLSTNTKADFSSIDVGTGNASIIVNGQLVKKVNTHVAKDPAGGPNAVPTTYMPIYYVDQIFQAAGINFSWDGSTWSVTSPKTQPAPTGQGTISSVTVSSQKVGEGTQVSPAVSFGDPLTVSVKLTDVNGNPITGVNATLDLTSTDGAPTVNVNNTIIAPTSTTSNSDGTTTFKYAIPTDSSGTATAQVSVGTNISANYKVEFEAPFNQSGTTYALKSSKAYIEFVASNTLGVSPSNNYNAPLSSGADATAGVVPVTVTIPPNGPTAQSGVPVTFSFVTPGSAYFSTSAGGSIGTGQQTVYTDSNGQAVVYVAASSATSATVRVSAPNYNDITRTIKWNQAGMVTQVANKSVTNVVVTPSGGSSSANSPYVANLGNNVTFQATAEDQNGNPVANAQLLVVATTVSNGADTNSAHGKYVNGTTAEGFPSVTAATLAGLTNASNYGEIVTTDASGNFSFTVSDDKLYLDHYYVYPVTGGIVSSTGYVWNEYVQWQSGTTATSIGLAVDNSEIYHNNSTLTGLSVGAGAPSTTLRGDGLPVNLPVVSFDAFNGQIPLQPTVNGTLNQTYTLSTTARGKMYGIYVDTPNPAVPASN
ncbi:MAG: hypothetical protein K6T26_04090 [Alicyclobacillus sp.]|nr:hypothetical protein [Alicyclobacillus sp.]